MHDVIDTEKADLQGEQLWHQRFKQSVREELGDAVLERFQQKKAFNRLHERCYGSAFDTYNDFATGIARLVVIGAENGADRVWAGTIAALESRSVVPDYHTYNRELWPLPIPEALRKKWLRQTTEEYLVDHRLCHLYEHHHPSNDREFPALVAFLAANLLQGVSNGANDTLVEIYRAFMSGAPLPVKRRYSRMLRSW